MQNLNIKIEKPIISKKTQNMQHALLNLRNKENLYLNRFFIIFIKDFYFA